MTPFFIGSEIRISNSPVDQLWKGLIGIASSPSNYVEIINEIAFQNGRVLYGLRIVCAEGVRVRESFGESFKV